MSHQNGAGAAGEMLVRINRDGVRKLILVRPDSDLEASENDHLFLFSNTLRSGPSPDMRCSTIVYKHHVPSHSKPQPHEGGHSQNDTDILRYFHITSYQRVGRIPLRGQIPRLRSEGSPGTGR